eukprot:1847428-Alexandrium_andersonii.AAC.1
MEGETRPERRQVVEAWLTHCDAWGYYKTTISLNGGKGKGKMLGFSQMEAHSKDDRESLLRIISSHKMTGFYGNEIWGKRNIA